MANPWKSLKKVALTNNGKLLKSHFEFRLFESEENTLFVYTDMQVFRHLVTFQAVFPIDNLIPGYFSTQYGN